MLVEIALILAPVFIIVFIGFLIGRYVKINESSIKFLSKLLIYIFVPALVFISTIKNTIGHTTLVIILFALLIVSVTGIISSILARMLKLDSKSKSGFMLTAMFMNSGSMGSVICLILYGENGFLLAIMFYITTQVMLYTVGIFIASHKKMSFTFDALKPVITLPLIYALVIGLVLHFLNVQPSEDALRPVSLLSNAAVPMLLITLGLQLSRIKLERNALQLPAVSTAVRIGLGFVIAFTFTYLFGIRGIERNVILILSVMPTKITTFPLASQFDCNSENVSMTILFSMFVSIITTPLVLLSLQFL